VTLGRTGEGIRLLVIPAALLLGVVVAVFALAAHRDAARLGDLQLPWGLVLAVLGSALPSLALTAERAGRPAVAAYGAGWCLTVFVLVGGRDEGDYVLAADGRGWGFLGIASLAVVAVTMWGIASGGAGRSAAAEDPDDLLRVRR
jgi:hypothetical protein